MWKSVIGTNMFAHESGIHADGVIKNPKTYEVFSPDEVGLVRQIVVGKHSGARRIELKFDEYGIELTHEEAAELLPRVRTDGDRAEALAVRQGAGLHLQGLQAEKAGQRGRETA